MAGEQTLRVIFDAPRSEIQFVPVNPAAAVRGPKYSTRRGKTPVLPADEARQLLDSIDTSTLVGLRDRALIGLMVFTFACVGAATSMDVQDWYFQNRHWWVRLHDRPCPIGHDREAPGRPSYSVISAGSTAGSGGRMGLLEPATSETRVSHIN